MPKVISPVLTVALLACVLVACGREEDCGDRSLAFKPFEELFVSSGYIRLEEPDTAVISDIRILGLGPDGRMVIPDAMQSQVRVYDSDGRLLRSLGRVGEGPGEFRRPVGAAFDAQGAVYVVDLNQRVTRFTPDLELDTIFRLERTEFGNGVSAVDSLLIINLVHPGTPGHEFAFYTNDGRWVGGFHPQNPLIGIPYWVGPFREFLAVGRDYLIVAESMLYPLYKYSVTGEPVDTFGTPPKSWIQASRPQAGQFKGADARFRYEKWLRTFTTISGVFVLRNDFILVEHEKLDPDDLMYRESTYRLDIYRNGGGKTYEDILLPGRILAANDRLYVLGARPPSPWTIHIYDLAR